MTERVATGEKVPAARHEMPLLVSLALACRFCRDGRICSGAGGVPGMADTGGVLMGVEGGQDEVVGAGEDCGVLDEPRKHGAIGQTVDHLLDDEDGGAAVGVDGAELDVVDGAGAGSLGPGEGVGELGGRGSERERGGSSERRLGVRGVEQEGSRGDGGGDGHGGDRDGGDGHGGDRKAGRGRVDTATRC